MPVIRGTSGRLSLFEGPSAERTKGLMTDWQQALWPHISAYVILYYVPTHLQAKNARIFAVYLQYYTEKYPHIGT